VDSLTGVATAVAGGAVVVRAISANGVEGMGTLTVRIPGGTARISFSGRTQSDPALPVGFEDQLFATVFDDAGQRNTAPVTWGTTTPDLVRVDERGSVRAIAAGRATVTARAADGFVGSWTVLTTVATASTTAQWAENAEFGEPTDADPSDDFIVRRTQFTASWNRARGGPNWVSYDLEASHFGTLDRCDCFSPDPLLPENFRPIGGADYTSGGYDRGHLVRSFDRTTGALDNATTFYTTNILPQTADNNQGPWAVLEDSLGKLARTAGKEVHIVTGGAGSLGTIRNEGYITIPAYTWKVAVVMRKDGGLADVRGAGDVDAVIAVVMPNVSGIRNVPWTTYAVTVDSVQRLTGYDLLARLPDHIERQLETGSRPPVVNAGGNDGHGAYVGAEGAPVAFAATATDPDGEALTYAWSFGDGATGTGAAPQHAYADDGTYAAVLTVTDTRGVFTRDTVQVRVANVIPVVASFAGATILRGERYALAGTFADPGADTWTGTVAWGDGASAPLALDGQGFGAAHVFATAGTHTVTVTVRDDDAGVGTREAVVLVRSPAEGIATLEDDVRALGTGTLGVATPRLTPGNVTALLATLDASSRALARGEIAAAVSALDAFVAQVAAYRTGGLVSPAAAERLTAYARRLQRSIAG
jgi:DNA/RNA endonuclease G (NUC1)